MCRLLGISYGKKRESLDAAEIAAIMFPALVHQGPHAYGWMTAHPEYGIDYRKFAGRCDTDEAWENILTGVDSEPRWFVGHTRFATHGDPANLNNDHPIPHKDLVGVHNGVIRNHAEILGKTGRHQEDTQVDSEAIFAAVHKWGPSKGLRKIKGDMVAIWGDNRRPKNLYIARSAGRQLTLGWTAQGNIIFASERQALERLRPEITFTHFSTIAENKLLTLRGGEIVERTRFSPVAPVVHTRALREPGRSRVVTPRGSRPIRGITDHFANENDKHGVVIATDEEVEDARAAAAIRAASQQALARRRGELLFPKDKGKKTPPVDPEKQRVLSRRTAHSAEAREWLDAARKNELVEWNGMLVTLAEYQWLTEGP